MPEEVKALSAGEIATQRLLSSGNLLQEDYWNDLRLRFLATLAARERELANSESIRKSEKEILIQEIAAHSETKRELAEAQAAIAHWHEKWNETHSRMEALKAENVRLREAATQMLDELDNATAPDEWSTSELRAALSPAPADPRLEAMVCQRCGRSRTEAEGGRIFTVCDTCWDAIAALDKEADHAS